MQEQWPKRARDVIKHSIELLRARQWEEALSSLDKTLADAPEADQTGWTRILCRHAAVIAQAQGDLRREIQYTKRALLYAKDYQFALYNLAQLLLRDGQVGPAERYAAEAYDLSQRGKTKADADLGTAILRQWPGIGKNQ